MSYLVMEVTAPTEQLRDEALKRAQGIVEKGKNLFFISVGLRPDTKKYFFSFMSPICRGPASEIIGEDSHKTGVVLTVLWQVIASNGNGLPDTPIEVTQKCL